MGYSQAYLEKSIEKSCSQLFKDQPMLFDAKNNINEQTISGELAKLLEHYFKEYHVNCEYNRMTDENGIQIPKRISLDPNHPDPSLVYPDIIIHNQRNSKNNLAIFEIKMAWKNDKKMEDFEKLTRYIEELSYNFGIYLELGEEGITNMKWF